MHKGNQRLQRTSPLPIPRIWRPPEVGCSYPACSTASSSWGRLIRRSRRRNRWEEMLQCQWVSPSEDSSPPHLNHKQRGEGLYLHRKPKKKKFWKASQLDQTQKLNCIVIENELLTCCGDAIKPDKSIETGGSTGQNSRETERHKTTNTQTLFRRQQPWRTANTNKY